MKHLDLFSGIGGFALAARWAGWETLAFCEKEKYAKRVLGRHWPNVPIIDDIRGIKEPIGCDILTGGFPCQPFSFAGKQKGKADDRYLWPEMLRVIALERPAWVVGENVAGIVGVALDQALFDLEAQGYSSRAFILPACAVDAPHRRDRVWILANRTSNGQQRGCQSPVPREQDLPRELSGSRQDKLPRWSAEPGVCRVVNGIPNRAHRIKALGNAVVPQVVYQIFKAIDKQ